MDKFLSKHHFNFTSHILKCVILVSFSSKHCQNPIVISFGILNYWGLEKIQM